MHDPCGLLINPSGRPAADNESESPGGIMLQSISHPAHEAVDELDVNLARDNDRTAE